MNNLQITELTLDSREVAEMLPKRHTDLLRDVEKYSNYLEFSIERNFALNEFWQESAYKDKIGRTLKCYQITKKGCEFLAHKMTGKKGAIFTATYINRFHEMEEQLQKSVLYETLPRSPKLLTYKGEPVVTLLILETLIGLDHTTALWMLKSKQIPYYHLKHDTLRAFKYENGYMNSANSLVVVNRENAFKLLKHGTREYTIKTTLLSGYFDNLLETKELCMNTIEVAGLLCLSKILGHIPDKELRGSASIAIAKSLDRLGVWELPITVEDSPHSAEGWSKIALTNNCWELLSMGRVISKGTLSSGHKI